MVVVNDKAKIHFLTDRSAVEMDDKCGMKWFWNRKYGARGIVPKDQDLALRIGGETHEDLARIAEMEDISQGAIQEVVDDLIQKAALSPTDRLHQGEMELFYRRLGWLVGFALFIEPKIREQYDDIGIEKELILDRDPLFVPVTPDRVLKAKHGDMLVYREYKSTITAKKQWIMSWHWKPQLHIGMAAIQEETQKRISFAQIMGLMKGSYSEGENPRLRHPYVWGYQNVETGEWACKYEDARSRDWLPMPVWEYEGGIVEWVKKCGEETAKEMFPHSPPVFLNHRLLSSWVARRINRERRVHPAIKTCQTNHHIREVLFEMRTNECQPAFGSQCPYLAACHNATINEDPLKSGQYIERQPHHEVEIVGLD